MTNYDSLTAQVELARSGDRSAFSQVVERTQNLVTSVALAIVHDIRASEDIAQEAYVQTWQKLKQLQHTQSFLPWLRQITRHCAYQWLEREKHNHQARTESLEQALDQLVLEQQADAELDQQQRQTIITAALSRLPDDSRDIVLLYYREQQSTEHVAELLGLEPATVRQKLSRARKALADDLLKRVGKAALLSAPSLSVTAILSSAAMLASPPAAAATGLSLTGALGGAAKWVAVVGIAAIGLLGALAGLFIGSQRAQKYAPTADAKQRLITLRNRAAVFLTIVGGLFYASYEFDPGWIAPSLTYCLMVSGVMYYQVKTQAYVESPKSKRWTCYLGAVVGFVSGFGGLVAGFILSGRI